MKAYLVGGSVRDELLGLPVQDHDYVVVGSTPEEMVRRGYRPVGKDFPVFLHPQTQEEYALARTERKSGRGYKGFQVYAAPEVTLEEDLRRRDLTINAIAKDEHGNFVDPFGGIADLRAGVLRHVSEAFAEDPLRILRVARFAARYGFAVATDTMAMMHSLVATDELYHLVPERVWQELARGLMEKKPSRMFDVLRACGALAKLLPEVDRLYGVPQRPEHHPEIDTGVHVMMVIDYAAAQDFALPVRFAALTHDLGKGETPPQEWPKHHGHEQRSVELVEQVCARLRVPTDCRDLALLAARYHGDIHRALELNGKTTLKLLESSDALRRPERFEQLLQACESDARGRAGLEQRKYPQSAHLLRALAAVKGIDEGAIARPLAATPARIPEAIHRARLAALKAI
jgi:tRNA nucleotidyltransferase (CCA-adding enzyme)